jgi:hypothetical protein
MINKVNLKRQSRKSLYPKVVHYYEYSGNGWCEI